MTATFDFIDLFAGIGGFHQALTELGGRCVLASEIDQDAAEVYTANYGMPVHGDIRVLTEQQDPRETIPDHDVLCAGFPCQPFSKSGFQLGINETRGTLFHNILLVLQAKKPQFVILENVRNLAGPRHRQTWKTIIRNLRRLGYRVSSEPTVFSPHLLPPGLGGAPQVRDRVFILAEFVGTDVGEAELESPPLVDKSPVGAWNPHEWDVTDILQADAAIGDRIDDYRISPRERTWLEAWADFIEVIPSDGLPGFPIWVDAFEPVPAIDDDTPEWKANFLRKNADFYVEHRSVIDSWMDRHGLDDEALFPPSRRKFEWQARRHQPTRESRDLWDLVMHLRPSGVRVKPPTYLPALVAITQTSIIGARQRRITPREAARLQGFPDLFQLPASDAAAYKQFGNAVNVGAVKWVAQALFESAGWTKHEPAGYEAA